MAMANKTPKFSVGDILCLKENPNYKRKVVYIYDIHYFDIFYPLESAYAEKEFCYRTAICDNDDIEPTELSETIINKYYTKLHNNSPRIP